MVAKHFQTFKFYFKIAEIIKKTNLY